jgi:ribonuclease HI
MLRLPSVVYVDGACSHNHARGKLQKEARRAAYGIYVDTDHPWNEGRSIPLDAKATNQTAELHALRAVLVKIRSHSIMGMSQGVRSPEAGDTPRTCITVKTDSMYVVNIVNSWAEQWSRLGWQRRDRKGRLQPIQNLELIREVVDAVGELNQVHNVAVSVRHVPAHRPPPQLSPTTIPPAFRGLCTSSSPANPTAASMRESSAEYRDWYGNMQADLLARQAVQ